MTTVRFQRPMTPYGRARLAASAGWSVMPLRTDTKQAFLRDWPDLASTDAKWLNQWWPYIDSRYEVGIVTGAKSGIWVLDIDVKKVNGFITAHVLFEQHGVTKLPDTFRVQSPSGGQQWFFTYPTDDRKIGNSPLGPGIDVRGDRGQVVAPWSANRPVLNEVLPTPAPDWLVDLLVKKPESRKPLVVESTGHATRITEQVARQLVYITEGGRNHALNKASFALGMVGAQGFLSETDARIALYEACSINGLLEDDGELGFEATFNSGWNAGTTAGGNEK